ADALERFGFAYGDVESLVFTRDAGIALADATIDALAQGARAAGADIREHTRVESLDDVPGERVIVTAGGWAPKLLGRGRLDTNVGDESFGCGRRGRYVIGSACSGHGFKFAPAVGELLAGLA